MRRISISTSLAIIGILVSLVFALFIFVLKPNEPEFSLLSLFTGLASTVVAWAVVMPALRSVRSLGQSLSNNTSPYFEPAVPFAEFDVLQQGIGDQQNRFQQERNELLSQNHDLEDRIKARTADLTTMMDMAAHSVARPAESNLLGATLSELERSLNYSIASVWMRKNDRVLLSKVHMRQTQTPGPGIQDDQPLPIGLVRTYEELERAPETMVVNQQVRRNIFRWLIEQLLQSRVAEVLGAARSWAAVPLVAGGRMIGLLRLDHAEEGYFTSERVRLLNAVANQLALGVEYTRLHAQAEMAAVMAERSRIARDLHDAVSQTLFATSVTAVTLEKNWTREPDKNTERLAQIRRLAQSAQDEMRLMLFELRPDAFQQASMGVLLRQLASASASRSDYRLHLSVDESYVPTQNAKMHIYRIVQEALNNVAKHSKATESYVRLERSNSHMVLSIRDNGVGMKPDQAPSGRLGLTTMRERATELGATFEMKPAPEGGTLIELSWQIPN